MPAALRNALLLLALCVLAAWAYAPGLSGGYLFDDLINLPALGATGAVDDWPTFWRYITSGVADPTGRPLALLSFLIDARDWPASPAPFLRTNLALHLLNGALLFVLLRQLGRQLDGASQRNDAAALLGAGLWTLHPLFVSTTLYIVQREAMLPATFTLLGLIAWTHGRDQWRTTGRTGVAWMVAGIGLGTLLAVLSKANGILLPLLAWMLEATVFNEREGMPGGASHPIPRRLRITLLVLPSLVTFAGVASFLLRLDEPLFNRSWTIGERLLTEPRVMLDYLQLLVVPRALSTGLYNDGYVVSTSLFQPGATLPAALIVLGLLAAAVALRRRAPAWSAALLFFFAGHLLESTAIPLELYFEHRNYLPALLLFWPLARALCHWQVATMVRVALALALLGLFAFITHQRATLWGQPGHMARLWAQQNPQSPRAQAGAAMAEIADGQPGQAMQRLVPLWRQQPHELQLALSHADAACALRGLQASDVDAVAQAFRHARHGQQLVYSWLGSALHDTTNQACSGLDLDTIATWLDAAAANPMMQAPGRRQDLASLAGRLALLRGEPDVALAHFNRALAAYVAPGTAAQQATLLASGGHHQQALDHLDHYRRLSPRTVRETGWNMPRLHQWVLDHQGYWPRELTRLRGMLRADLQLDEGARDPINRPSIRTME